MSKGLDNDICKSVSDELSVDVSDVRSAVDSFFFSIKDSSKKLPFNNRRKIYLKDKFESYVSVQNIPYIGRIGPSYSRYLKWRRNEAKQTEQSSRDSYKSKLTEEDIDCIVEAVLSGKKIQSIPKRKKSELYESIWIVGSDGKRLARQVIPKKNKNVQD